MKSLHLISVIGAADCDQRESAFAEEVGQLLAEAGFGVVCGGRGGVMEAVCRGAWVHGGFTLGILPSVDRDQANRYLSVILPTGLGEARNVLVVLAGEVVLAIGGGYGTLTEIAHALRHEKPVVGFQTWRGHRLDLGELPIHRVESPAEAIKSIQELMGSRA
jgi:uncharacterized protein (TIGR00725 family)